MGISETNLQTANETTVLQNANDPNTQNITDAEKYENTLRTFLEKRVQKDLSVNIDCKIVISEIKFGNVHRVGGPTNKKRRPVIAQFLYSKQRELSKNAGVNLKKKKSEYYVNEQLPEEIEELPIKMLKPTTRTSASSCVARCMYMGSFTTQIATGL